MIDELTPIPRPDNWDESAPDYVCLECGAINAVKVTQAYTEIGYEWDMYCTVCGAENIEEDSSAMTLALIIASLRKQVEELLPYKERAGKLYGDH